MITTSDVINTVFITNETAAHMWRVGGIANRFHKHTPHSIYVTPWGSWNDRLPEGTNLVVLQLVASPKLVDISHELGAKVILEADDAWVDSYKEDRKNLSQVTEGHKEWIVETLKKVDALTVTNQTLKDNYARFTDKPIHILPNYVDYDWYGEENLMIRRTTDEIRIGWFGSHGHLEDLQMVTPALNKILHRYPNAKFIYCGFGSMSSDSLSTEVAWGEDVFKAIPRDRREFYPGVNESVWPMKHRYLDLDIGIAPLIDDYFNRNKTPIKWMEYSVLGTPSVVSPTLYEDFVDHNRTGLIANDTDGWFNCLSELIEDKKKRKLIGDRARAVVKAKYDLNDHWHKWLDVYNEVVLG